MENKEYSEFVRSGLTNEGLTPYTDYDTTNKTWNKASTNEPTKITLTEADTTASATKPLFTDKNILNDESYFGVTILDKDWARQAFLVSDIELANNGYSDEVNRYWSSASKKFTDTRIGGNLGINARPQFTRYSDIRDPGRLSNRTDVSVDSTSGRHGMGRYYSEAIDDNAQTIYLRFGVPQFSSLFSFFGKAFDPNASKLARTGSGAGFLYRVGVAAGTVAAIVQFPVLSSVIFGGRLMSYFFTRPTSKYYTMKPTMHLYWSTVQSLVNTIAVNKGLIPRSDSEFVNSVTGASYEDINQIIGSPYKLNKEYLDMLHDAMPDLFTKNYGIDVMAIANRAQRIANALNEADYNAYKTGSVQEFTGRVQRSFQNKVKDLPGSGFGAWMDHILKLGNYFVSDYDKTNDSTQVAINPKVNPATGKEYESTYKDSNNQTVTVEPNPDKNRFIDYFDAEFREGAGFAIFKVDHTGSVSEAFSNSVVESDISQKFNGMSSQMREAKFSLQGGNITGSALEEAVKGVIGGAADVVTGVLSGVSFGLSDALLGLGSGYIDVPKHWQSSSATLPRSTYTMQLISPYGNVISQMQNIFIPLAMIMAGSLPLSTGKQSYTSPFLCQLWDRGRQQIQLGMIESLSIQRGTCNLPFTNKGNVLAIDVSFSVVDLSSIMHMPISTGGLFGITETGNPIMDEDNTLFDYLAVLAGQDIYSQYYAIPKARLNFAKTYLAFDKLTSPAYWASVVHDSATSGMLQKVTLGAGNLLEGLTAGANTVTQQQR